MKTNQRIGLVLSLLVISIVYFFLPRSSTSKSHPDSTWSTSPHSAVGDYSKDEQDIVFVTTPPLPNRGWTEFQPPQNGSSLFSESPAFAPGVPKPAGSTYTKGVVMGRTGGDNITWLDTVELPPSIRKYVYDIDPRSYDSSLIKSRSLPLSDTNLDLDPDSEEEEEEEKQEAPLLRVSQPSGHEAMPYLTYIIDNYGGLPDISIFIHPHRHAWHNNELLNNDVAEHIKRLSAETVTRHGYMNLRCRWKPGCPEHIHPLSGVDDVEKREEAAMAAAWEAMFPNEPVPEVMAAPCCAQFAVSRERIESVSLNRYVVFREWLVKTTLPDRVSGRVFEYFWHKIFTGQSTVCPDMRVCHCDGYGVCFVDDVEFDYWFRLLHERREAEKKLEEWRELVEELDSGKGTGRKSRFGMKVPAKDGDVVLQRKIDGYTVMLEERRLQALEAGKDPRVRARVAGREWKEGGGY